LIRVDKRSANILLPSSAHPFRLITTREWKRTNRKQTKTGQKIFAPQKVTIFALVL
jgi:hypothetical protein